MVVKEIPSWAELTVYYCLSDSLLSNILVEKVYTDQNGKQSLVRTENWKIFFDSLVHSASKIQRTECN